MPCSLNLERVISQDPVSERMGPAFMNTLKLTLISSVVVMITSVVLGIVSALTSGRFTDRAIRSIAFLLTALPSYCSFNISYLCICKTQFITNLRTHWSRKLYSSSLCYYDYLYRNLF